MYMQTCSSCGRHRRSLRLLTWDFIFRNYLSLFLTTKLKQTEVYLISVNWSNWKWRKWNGVFFSRRWRHDSFQETRRFPFTEVRKINSVYEAGKGCWSTVQSNFPNDIFQSAATVTMATPDLPYSINSWGTRRSSEELPSTCDMTLRWVKSPNTSGRILKLRLRLQKPVQDPQKNVQRC